MNLIQHYLPDMKPGDKVELTFFPTASSGVLKYSAWIDYDRNRKFDGIQENVVKNVEGGHAEIKTVSFTIPQDMAIPKEGIKTR